MRIATLVVLLAAALMVVASSQQAPAQSAALCAATESRGEGHWPIAESGFTQERARESLESLSAAVSTTTLEADFVKFETDLVYLEGYLRKRYAQQNEGTDAEVFCEFLRSEAYVRH